MKALRIMLASLLSMAAVYYLAKLSLFYWYEFGLDEITWTLIANRLNHGADPSLVTDVEILSSVTIALLFWTVVVILFWKWVARIQRVRHRQEPLAH
jgi:hypothetical protein